MGDNVMARKTIEVWTISAQEQEEEVKAAFPKLGLQRAVEVSHIDSAVLTDNLRDFLNNFQTLTLDTGEHNENGFAVQEIELSLGVSAKGGIALIGKAEVGIYAGIKVKLARPRPKR